MRQVVKYILVVAIAWGGYYAARRFDSTTAAGRLESADAGKNDVDQQNANNGPNPFVVAALIDTDRSLTPVPLPEAPGDVTKLPTLSAGANAIPEPPGQMESRETVEQPADANEPPKNLSGALGNSHEAPRDDYRPPALAEEFPPQDLPSTAGSKANRPPSRENHQGKKNKSSPKDRPKPSGKQASKTEQERTVETKFPATPKTRPAKSGTEARHQADQDPYQADETGEPDRTNRTETKNDDTDDTGEIDGSDQSDPAETMERLEDRETGDRSPDAGEHSDEQPVSEQSGVWVRAEESPNSAADHRLRKHTIVEGDTLRALAKRYLGDSESYLELYEANSNVLFDPRLLPIGVEIVIPDRNVGRSSSRSSG